MVVKLGQKVSEAHIAIATRKKKLLGCLPKVRNRRIIVIEAAYILKSIIAHSGATSQAALKHGNEISSAVGELTRRSTSINSYLKMDKRYRPKLGIPHYVNFSISPKDNQNKLVLPFDTITQCEPTSIGRNPL